MTLITGVMESHCRGMPPQEGEAVWFPLLDQLLSPPPAVHVAVAAAVGESCGAVVSEDIALSS